MIRVCGAYAFQSMPKTLWAHLAALNRAELLPPSPRLAFIDPQVDNDRCPSCDRQGAAIAAPLPDGRGSDIHHLRSNSYGIHGLFMSMFGWHSRGARYANRAVVSGREFDDIFGLAQSINSKGIGLCASGRYDEGLASLNEAIQLFDRTGDFWEMHLAQFHQGCCLFGLGNLVEAIAKARWVFASSARVGDTRLLCASWLWARATRGNIPFTDLIIYYPHQPDDIMSTVHGMLAEGYWHTFHGRTAEALQIYERAAEMVRNSLCVNSHTILVLPMLAMGLRLHADAVQAKDARQAEQLRNRACRAAKWATRLTWLFPAAYPPALRERALILAACGKAKQALKFADKSCVVAESQKAKYEHAQSLLVRGRLAKGLGLPEADEQIRTAEAAIDIIERPSAKQPLALWCMSRPPRSSPRPPRHHPLSESRRHRHSRTAHAAGWGGRCWGVWSL